MAQQVEGEKIVEAVREHYAAAAKRVQTGKASGCCTPVSGKISSGLYDLSELEAIPEGAAAASLGCGNPVLLAELKTGEVVLDLGSGGGIDVLLSAKRVGPAGKAYGLDMTDEMLELAQANARQAGATNVEFLKGRIEAIPLPDASVDVILSNCVINLSADKEAVLKEAFRVLKPGGRFAVADIVSQGGELPAEAKKMLALWASCISGALSDEGYKAKLTAVGFAQPELQVLKVYGVEDVREELQCCVPENLGLPAGVRVVSAFVRATKPLA